MHHKDELRLTDMSDEDGNQTVKGTGDYIFQGKSLGACECAFREALIIQK